MAGTLFVGAEEVLLRLDEASYAASQPIDAGLELVMALKSSGQVSTVVVACDTRDDRAAEYWVRMNGLKGCRVAPIRVEDATLATPERQWAQICRERARGPIWMVITAHSHVADLCRLSAQDVVRYFRRGSLGGPPEPKSWDELRVRGTQRREAEAMEDEPEPA